MLHHFVSFIVFICVPLCVFVLGAPTTRPPLCPTYAGLPCKFPFIYKGQRYTTCTTEDSPENAWCATLTGSDLTMTSWHYCPTCLRQDSTSRPAAPTNGTNFSTVNAQMARRCMTTESGIPCRFPFEYNGITYHECTTVDFGDTLWCATGDNPNIDYDVCQCDDTSTIDTPSASSTGSTQCLTYDGSPCVFPFTHKGQVYTNCTREDDTTNFFWCATAMSGPLVTSWGYCSEPQSEACSGRVSTPSPAAPSNAQMARRCTTTTSGIPCRFPFVYNGITYDECTTVDFGGTPWCATGDNPDIDYGICQCDDTSATPSASSTGSTQCLTYDGWPCVFPFTHKGQVYTNCTKEDTTNFYWCATAITSGHLVTSWGYCSEPQAKACSISPPASIY